MILVRADIQGFKSFAKRIHISFKPGITAVIGPNGSGKSNIAEAIRWVLGEQSTKALRAKERSDVLYAGEHGKATKAAVTLTFDNEEGRFPIHAAEITVTRSLTIQGESEYLVNNESVRLIDLTQMLAQSGIGTKSYTVISQGTVDRYLTATIQGRKELFDEATGIKSLQIKLGIANQKLEKTKQHAAQVRAIVDELAPRVTFLQRQINRYEQREQYEANFRIQQKLWYAHAWHNAAKELERLETEKSAHMTTIEHTRTKRIHVEQETGKTTRSILQDCKACLEVIIAGDIVDLVTIKRVHADIEKSLAPAKRVLDTSYEQEIRAEREDSAITAALEQLRNDLALLEQEILRECGSSALASITSQPPTEENIPTDQELRALSQKIASIGEKDPVVIKEYEEAKSRLQSLETQLSDIEITMDDILQSVQALHIQMKENFQKQFTRIQQSFTENFTELFGGGKADIISVPDGVDIIIAPPKKRPRHVTLLSGGEKTLTSLALIFAILDVQKPPFIVLDEVDAALDEANSKRFASLLAKRSHSTQSIVISHNRETMSVADILYGVTMHSDGTSHLYSVTIQDIRS